MVDLGPTATVLLARSEVLALAGRLDELSTRLAGRGARLGLIAVAMTPGASVSPATALAAESAIGVATLGPTGLVANAATLAATASAIRSALTLITGADEGLRFLSSGSEVLVGATVRSWLATSPAAPTAVDLLSAYAGTEGIPVLSLVATSTTASPRGFADLLRRLAAVNALPEGQIQIQTVVGADGRIRHVVYLPGTDSFDADAVRSWPSNASIRLDHPTTYQAGIVAAMQAAGIRPGEPVMLVGHSQGGMVAAQIARDPGPFTIATVVTAGSPIGDRPPPDSTGLIALEHTGDPVPALDGAPNASSPGHLTVTFSDGLGTPMANHGLGHYVHGAQAAESSDEPAVQQALSAITPFLGATPGTTGTWEISRAER